MKLEEPKTVLDTNGEKLCNVCARTPTTVTPPNLLHCTAANNYNKIYQNNPTAQLERPTQQLQKKPPNWQLSSTSSIPPQDPRKCDSLVCSTFQLNKLQKLYQPTWLHSLSPSS
jgi:hypothetical protein